MSIWINLCELTWLNIIYIIRNKENLEVWNKFPKFPKNFTLNTNNIMKKSYLFLTSVLLLWAFFVVTQCNKKDKDQDKVEDMHLFDDKLDVYKIIGSDNILTVDLILKKIILVPLQTGFGMSNSATDIYKIVDADNKIFELKANVAIGENINTNLSSKKGFKIYFNTTLLFEYK